MGFSLLSFQMLLGPSLLPDGDLISENNFDGFHRLTASICSVREVSLGKRCRDLTWMLIKRPCFNLQVATLFIQCFLVDVRSIWWWSYKRHLSDHRSSACFPPNLFPTVRHIQLLFWLDQAPAQTPRPLLTAEHLIPPLISLDCSQCFFCFDVWLFRPFVFLS